MYENDNSSGMKMFRYMCLFCLFANELHGCTYITFFF